MSVVLLSPDELKRLVAMAVSEALAQHANAIPQKDQVLTVKDAAIMLRRSEKHVRDLIGLGKLTAINSNRGTSRRPAYTILETDLRAYLKRLRG